MYIYEIPKLKFPLPFFLCTCISCHKFEKRFIKINHRNNKISNLKSGIGASSYSHILDNKNVPSHTVNFLLILFQFRVKIVIIYLTS